MGSRLIPTGETGEFDLVLLPSGEAVRAQWERFKIEYTGASWGEPETTRWSLLYRGKKLTIRNEQSGQIEETLAFPDRWSDRPDPVLRGVESGPGRYEAAFTSYRATTVGSAVMEWKIELDLAGLVASYRLRLDVDTDP